MSLAQQNGYLDMELLRFTTAGSVDDGKSTLIGRLLYDSKSIFEDQYEAVKRASIDRGEEKVNLALLTDGLRAEREQGITIDVAYRYFATPKRKFIIADTPGHIQYTRNMVTGASTANLAIVLIDARKGVIEQTKRHSYIASLLRIPHILLCVNKMDLVNYDEKVYNSIIEDFNQLSSKFNFRDTIILPISALKGDNVVKKSQNMSWYKGKTFLETLETVEISEDRDFNNHRMPVQFVIRPQREKYHDYRSYAGRIAGGVFKPGDEVIAYPSKLESKIKSIDTFKKNNPEAFPPMSVAMALEDDIDISRGDVIVKKDGNQPTVSNELKLMICWMHHSKLKTRNKYVIKHATKDARCFVTDINYKININNLTKSDADELSLNDIGCISLKTTAPLTFDSYHNNKITGSMVLIDEATNETVGAGMIV